MTLAKEVREAVLTEKARGVADLIMEFAKIRLHAEFAPFLFDGLDVKTIVEMAAGDGYIELPYPVSEEEARTEMGWGQLVDSGIITLK